MAESKDFAAEAGSAKVVGTVSSTDIAEPVAPPMGLRAIGPRITFHFVGEWDAETSYVLYDVVRVNGTSYIGNKINIAKGINPETDNNVHWVKWNDPNAQVELLQQTVNGFDARITAAETDAVNAAGDAAEAKAASASNTAAISAEVTRATAAESANTEAIEALVKLGTYTTPEHFGAVGDGVSDDTAAVQNALNSGKNVLGCGVYKCSSKLKIAKSEVAIYLRKIVSSSKDYAISIFNGNFNQQIIINAIEADNGGVIAETESISARNSVHINTINAKNGIAFMFAGGIGGVLDCVFNGCVWEGSTSGLTVRPSSSYIGNCTFNAIRFTASANGATQLTLDSSSGAITQLHFPNCSVEPESANESNNGILVNVVNNIEHCDGFFRATELTGKSGYILKIAGNVTDQLSQGLRFDFDHILPQKIDLSELSIAQYYALDNPIAIINSGKIVFASQSQTNQLVIKGAKKHCVPLRGRYAQSSGNYNWSFSRQIETAIEFTANGVFNIPEWLDPDSGSILINPGGHTITVKIDDHGTQQTIGTLNNGSWVDVKFYRTNDNKLYMVAK